MAATRAAADLVALASPYLSIRVAQQLAREATRSEAHWRLLTRLDPVAVAGGYLSTDGLRLLLEAGVQVRTTPRLHAKVYLVDGGFGIVGSANLTGSGLGGSPNANLELSHRLDPAGVGEAHAQFGEWWDATLPVSRVQLDEVDERARALPRTVGVQVTTDQRSSDHELAEFANLVADARAANLWVKAQYGLPDYDQWRREFWFSSAAHRRPSFAPGDLVLIYAKEVHACYAIVEVIDAPRNDPRFIVDRGGRDESEANRWPWVNRTSPRLVPSRERIVLPAELGFTGQGLQGGHRRIGLPEFVTAARALAGDV